jgi:hypothetical protein
MNFKFQPLGIPFSSSYALVAEVASAVLNSPISASMAQFTQFPVGPRGPCARIVTGSIIPIINSAVLLENDDYLLLESGDKVLLEN